MDAITITQNDFLDVLFNDRNKDYGAYSLRRQYEKRMRNAIAITALTLLALAAALTINSMLAHDQHTTMRLPLKDPAILRPVDLEKLEEKRIQPPPLAAVTTPPAAKPMIHNATLAVVPDDAKEITPPPTQEEMTNHAIGVVNAAGNPNAGDIDVPDMGGGGNGGVHIEIGSNEGTTDRPFTTVEVMPSFPGGETAMIKYLNNNVRYPSLAQENNIQGTVVVQFVVAPDGTIQQVKVLSTQKGGGLEEEAMRVIKKMPTWKPGRQNGRNVAVFFSLPIRFSLSEH
ncbi:protein TonB [Chitinophaga costaii]|uniref:Protein TonB n=1 Tax=Chitinophaga costaii TaxID=1335309 RepID=A0A1C4G040_9BACT|nr:energy transducer TonB [Chitinophaga costaii]PUZ19977.1 energy transducer TonB [Chitinophaga costaii]SCC61560.1 protein TonB [Chitinophaga costaii]